MNQAALTISPARMAAVRVLRTLETDNTTHASAVLSTCVTDSALSATDERLARTLVFGILRNKLALDFQYAPYLKQSPSKLHPVLRTLLQMAVYQHLYLTRVPDFAIGQQTVELAKKVFRLPSQQLGFLNAVLRKIVTMETPRPFPAGNKISDMSIRYSMPAEVVRLFVNKFGGHKAADIMSAVNHEPVMTIRTNTLTTNRENITVELEAAGFTVTPGVLSPDAFIVDTHPGGDSLFETEAFTNGLFYVQDEGSQYVSRIVNPLPGEEILDLCAAPGGKATHLAELTNGQVTITATDESERRLNSVVENIARLRTPAITVVPLETVIESRKEYDAVLVDAPCSGLGTIRRNPEIRYRITAEFLERQAERQMAALNQALVHVRPGGRLIYSTCSFTDQENAHVINRFLKENPQFSKETSPENQFLHKDNSYATWPDFPQIDGFEAVILRRS